MLAPFNDIVVRSIVVVGELEGEDQVEDERTNERVSERASENYLQESYKRQASDGRTDEQGSSKQAFASSSSSGVLRG